jgi:hypothetical protein
MRTLVLCGMLALPPVAVAESRGFGETAESPRATDLLRAQKMSDEVTHRLQLPAPKKRSAWVQGGGGWERREPKPDPPVTIKLVPPRAHVKLR